MTDNFTLAQLRCFIAVAESLSFRQAAERLQMTQPPLTRQVQALERALGVTLFDRAKNRVKLTPAGQVLFEDASRIFRDLANMQHNVKDIATTGIRSLKVSYHDSAERDLLPVTVSLFVEKYPDAHLHLVQKSTFDAEDALLSGEIDVALMRPSTRSTELDMTLIRQEALVAVLPGSHPFVGQEIDLVELRDEQFIGFSKTLGENSRSIVFNVCMTAGFTPKYSATTTSMPMLLSLIAAGKGISLVSEHQLRNTALPIGTARLRDEKVITMLVAAIVRERQSVLAQEFIDCAIRAAESLEESGDSAGEQL